MHISYHHIHHFNRRKKQHSPKKTRNEKIIDSLVYVASFLGILSNIPQLVKIWGEKSTAGVSVITWGGFLFGSVFWLLYGIIHNEKPVIVANFLFAVIQAFIIVGLMMPA